MTLTDKATSRSTRKSASSTGGHVEADCTVEELVARMRGGDRHAAAEFFGRYRSRIRRRVRGKLKPTMRRLFDSQDIMSTVGRRLDLYVRDRKLQAVSEEQLWSLMIKMADNALIDKVRLWDRVKMVEDRRGPFVQTLAERSEETARSTEDETIEIDQALGCLNDNVDKQILLLKLRDMQQSRIAHAMNLPATTVRKRWQRIRSTLRDRLERGDGSNG